MKEKDQGPRMDKKEKIEYSEKPKRHDSVILNSIQDPRFHGYL